MNRLVHQPKVVPEQPAKPYMTRRVIRYRAADNVREAIRRQYPNMFSFQAAGNRESGSHA
jgi:hypothetical protein